MAKTFTQNNSVLFQLGESGKDLLAEEIQFDNELNDMIGQLKNLRVRPSFSSMAHIMEYAKKSNIAEWN